MQGRCRDCGILKRITPLTVTLSRALDGPIVHDVPDRHVACGSVVEYVARNRPTGERDAYGTPQFDHYYEATCALCGVLSDDDDISRSHQECPGSRKPI